MKDKEMKYTLTVHDMDEAELNNVVDVINNQTNTSLEKSSGQPAELHAAAGETFGNVKGAVINNVITPVEHPTPSVDLPMTAAADHIEQAEIVETVIRTADLAELDATGIPWDARIHTSTQGKTVKGFWKRKPRVEDAEYDAIVAELQAATPVPSTPIAPIPPATFDPAVSPTIPAAPVAAPPQPAAPTPPAPAIPIGRDFAGMMQQLSNLFGASKVTPEYPNTILTRINDAFKLELQSLTDIEADPRMVEYAWECLEVDGMAV